MTGARELDGERRAPGTGAENGDGFLRDVVAGAVHGRAHERVRPRSARGASVRRALRGGLGGLLLRQSAREQLVEVHRRQHEVREAALRHELRHGHARVREQHVRADGADGAALIVGG